MVWRSLARVEPAEPAGGNVVHHELFHSAYGTVREELKHEHAQAALGSDLLATLVGVEHVQRFRESVKIDDAILARYGCFLFTIASKTNIAPI